MRGRYAPILAVLLAAPLALAAPPVEVPAEVKGEPGAFIIVRAKTDGTVVRFHPLDPGLNVFPGDLLTDRRATVVSSARPGRYRLLAYSSVKDEPTEPAVVVVVIGDPPVPPPAPPGPTPPPAPDALKTFRVLLIHETGGTLNQSQFGVMYGKPVRDWLDANTTKDGDTAGWRRRDKDAATGGDTAGINALWAGAKPKVTAVPCAAVERNGVVTVVPFEGTTDAMIETLTKLREGR